MAGSYIRKVSLIAYGDPPTPSGSGLAVPDAQASESSSVASGSAANSPGLELKDLRVQFQVNAMDTDAPPTAVIRVLNLADSTAMRIRKEFQKVTLQAGYENGEFGVIFQGDIVRTRRGRLSNIDTFLDIMAANLDAIYNFGVVNKTLKSGSSQKDVLNAIGQSVNDSPLAKGSAGALAQGVQYGSIPTSAGTGGTLPRGKVLFGMWRDALSDTADTLGCTWSIGADGRVNVIPLTGYLPDEAVVLTAQTGLVGIPEATPQGIEVKCLLNPKIKVGTRIWLNNASLTTTVNKGAVGFPAYSDFQFFANTSDDGFYRVYVVEHEGDSRGDGADWLTKIVALAVDSSSGKVAAYG